MGSNTKVCPSCHNQELHFDSQWRPPRGLDPSMRRFLCRAFRCDEEVYFTSLLHPTLGLTLALDLESSKPGK